MENNPATMISTAARRGTVRPANVPIFWLSNPTESITGRVPSQNTNIIPSAFSGLAEASARATKAYSHPHGRKVVTTPIRKGFTLSLSVKTRLAAFARKVGVLFRRNSELLAAIPVSWAVPVAMSKTPLMIAAKFSTGATASIVFPSSAAIIPSSAYVVKRPRLYRK